MLMTALEAQEHLDGGLLLAVFTTAMMCLALLDGDRAVQATCHVSAQFTNESGRECTWHEWLVYMVGWIQDAQCDGISLAASWRQWGTIEQDQALAVSWLGQIQSVEGAAAARQLAHIVCTTGTAEAWERLLKLGGDDLDWTGSVCIPHQAYGMVCTGGDEIEHLPFEFCHTSRISDKSGTQFSAEHNHGYWECPRTSSHIVRTH
jgi:hypothetical protein